MSGIIVVDSERGRELGFTSENFAADSYLWEQPEYCRVLISLIISKRKGAFKALIAAILAEDKTVAIPTPLGDMQRIVEKNGYTHLIEDTEIGPCHVWTLSPTINPMEQPL